MNNGIFVLRNKCILVWWMMNKLLIYLITMLTWDLLFIYRFKAVTIQNGNGHPTYRLGTIKSNKPKVCLVCCIEYVFSYILFLVWGRFNVLPCLGTYWELLFVALKKNGKISFSINVTIYWVIFSFSFEVCFMIYLALGQKNLCSVYHNKSGKISSFISVTIYLIIVYLKFEVGLMVLPWLGTEKLLFGALKT